MENEISVTFIHAIGLWNEEKDANINLVIMLCNKFTIFKVEGREIKRKKNSRFSRNIGYLLHGP